MSETENNKNITTDKSTDFTSRFSTRKAIRARLEELEKQVETLKTENESERDKRLRLAAEFDNYRRRTASEYRQLAETAGERIITKLLPVFDDFDRMMAHQNADCNALKQGFDLIFRKLQSVFESEGVAAIPAIGVPFDASLHEAVAQLPQANVENGSIVAEIERGYRLRDKIIRHSKVIVAQAIEPTEDNAGEQNG